MEKSENVKPQGIKRVLNWRTALGVALGIVAGYAYYSYIGCSSGSCAITSSPYMSMLWGGITGGVLLMK